MSRPKTPFLNARGWCWLVMAISVVLGTVGMWTEDWRWFASAGFFGIPALAGALSLWISDSGGDW